ncbi:MAG TPA: hypothetical protein VNB94_05445 [Mycobacteriales bacterium]|nr:hypothetical protein [Mycobacteriales bacterium]
MGRTGRRAVLLAALAGWCLSLSGCVPQGLAFKVDERLRFIAPEDRATVRLPVTVDWEIEDFEITGPGGEPRAGAGYFAVFVDETPMPAGKDLRWIARKDRSCRESEGCPDEEYLNTRGIYTTTDTVLVLDQLPRGRDEDRRERHRVTVVLLDASGRRLGESAFAIAFDVQRKAD